MLPVFMPFGRFRGRRIHSLPDSYLRWALTQPFEPRLHAALVAEDGFRSMADDQWTGRL